MGNYGTTEYDEQQAVAVPRPRATATVSVKVFGALAGLMIGLGVLLGLGPRFSSALAWAASSFADLGVESGMLVGSGVIWGGLAVLSSQVQRMGQQAHATEMLLNYTESLCQDMQRLVERTTGMHASLHQLRESQATGLRLLQEQGRNQGIGQQVDATYHLAASLDQLGRQLDERLAQQERAVEVQFGSLGQALSESKAEVRNMLEETRYLRREEILRGGQHSHHARDLAGEPLLHDEVPLNEAEMELRVELEEWQEELGCDPDAQGEGKIDVSAFNWDDVEIPGEHRHVGLGLSSAGEQPERVAAPLPSPGSSPLEWEGSDSQPRTDKLGRLDELGEDGTRPIPRAPAPGELENLKAIAPVGGRPLEENNEPELFTKEDLDKAWQAFRRGERE